jgi:4-amino-4-deoxy-L-arabinose transferase-like glycosyltransferase
VDAAKVPLYRVNLRANLTAWLSATPAWLWVMLVIGGGILLRVSPWLARYPLHRDEALYGTWARMIAAGSDPALLTAWVDKPPLTLYALAGSFRLFGVSDASLRLPGLLASIATLPLAFGLARRILDRQGALLATALVAASPFAILFTPTAFTDPWLTMWIVAACWAALARRPFWAGVGLGLAVASKQTGVLVAPLVAALLVVAEAQRPEPTRGRWRWAWSRCIKPFLRLLFGFGLVFGAVCWWDSLRWAKRPSFWARSLDTYGGLFLAPPAGWPERAARWAEQLGYLFGTPALTGLAMLLAGLAVRGTHGPRRPIILCLAAYLLGYLCLHFFVTFQPWDRYLLPLVPMLAILVAAGWRVSREAVTRRASRMYFGNIAMAIALGLVVFYPAWLGLAGRLPVGSDHNAYAGLDQVMSTLRTLAPRSIIYHHSLGWHLDFYLYGAHEQPVWWADVPTLAQDAAYAAAGDPDRPQWLVLAWAGDAPVGAQALAALADRGIWPDERQTIFRPDGTPSFTLYELLPSQAGP